MLAAASQRNVGGRDFALRAQRLVKLWRCLEVKIPRVGSPVVCGQRRSVRGQQRRSPDKNCQNSEREAVKRSDNQQDVHAPPPVTLICCRHMTKIIERAQPDRTTTRDPHAGFHILAQLRQLHYVSPDHGYPFMVARVKALVSHSSPIDLHRLTISLADKLADLHRSPGVGRNTECSLGLLFGVAGVPVAWHLVVDQTTPSLAKFSFPPGGEYDRASLPPTSFPERCSAARKS